MTEPNSLILQNVKKTFGNNVAVNIPSLSIRHGTFTCIVGKSGCGKTTLLRLLAGLETPDPPPDTERPRLRSGDRTNQAAVSSEVFTGRPAKTAPVFQEPRLMPWLTVTENIMFAQKGAGGLTTPQSPSAPPEERCKQLLKELELTDAATLYPHQLSGGMAQRVSLGRTLFYDPDLILMDEPFNALDYFTRQTLQKMVRRLFRHHTKTILFITHDVEEALLLGDRILIMEQGGIKADIQVTLPFPRKAADAALQDIRQKILDLLSE